MQSDMAKQLNANAAIGTAFMPFKTADTIRAADSHTIAHGDTRLGVTW